MARRLAGRALALALALAAQPASAAEGVALEPATSPLLAEQRDVALVVPDVVAAEGAIARAAGEVGGTVLPGGAVVEVRVPRAKLETFLAALDGVGRTTSRSGSSVDVTVERADLESALRSTRAARERTAAARRLATKVVESVAVERRLEELDAEAAGLESSLHALSRRVATVLVRVALRREVEVPPVPEVRLPFPWLDQLSLDHLQGGGSGPSPDPTGIRSILDVALQLEGHRLVDRPDGLDAASAMVGAVRMRGASTDPVGFAAGTDFALGGFDGFAFDVAMMGGVGTALGSVITLGLVGGAGYDVWTGGRLRGGLKLPVELFATLELSEAARLLVFAQPRWVPTPGARHARARVTELADEVSLGGAVLLPFAIGEDEIDDGGLRLGFTYAEAMGAKRFVATAGIGWGVLED